MLDACTDCNCDPITGCKPVALVCPDLYACPDLECSLEHYGSDADAFGLALERALSEPDPCPYCHADINAIPDAHTCPFCDPHHDPAA